MTNAARRPAIPDEVVDWVERLHGVVEELVAPIVTAHGPRLVCRTGCRACCSDGLEVFEIEAAVIERHHADLLAEGTANEDGGCAFLDERGACRVYEHRPYVCRTQGLPLRWLEREGEGEGEGEPVEIRDVCPLNADGPAIETLDASACWTVGPFEARLATRQASIDGTQGRRVPLRSLFAHTRRRLPLLP